MTGFKPASGVVYKGCIHLCADRRKITFRFGENRHFQVGVDRQNPTDGSIEYVKEFLVEGEFVKVAVRLAKTVRFYARSLYVLNNARVKNYIGKGTLKKT